jgi:hypothetical protein
MRTVLNGLWRRRRAVLFYVVLLGAGWLIGLTFQNVTFLEMRPMNEPMIHRIVMISLVAFVFTAAIPFVPGAEIGFGLLLMFGGMAAPIVYFGMVGALCLSFVVARLVPRGPLCRFFTWLGLTRAASLVADLDEAAEQDREGLILSHFPAGLTRRFVDYRYVLLALAINLPGNSIVGGGGGLAFVAGLSGLFGFWAFLATVGIAVAPIPLAFLILA